MREVTILAVLAARAARVALGAEHHLPGDFSNLHDALEALRPGDVLLLGDGTYTADPGSVSMRAGDSGAVITVRAEAGANPVISAGSGDSAFRFKADWWTVEGVKFDGRDSGRDVIVVSASHIVLRNCTVTNGNRDGVDIGGAASDVEIDGCLIYDMNWPGDDAHGVVAGRATDVRILNCEIYNCTGDSIQIFADGVPLADQVLISGCHLWNGWSERHENAIDVKASTNVTISNNLCHGFKGLSNAIVIHQAVTNVIVEKNLIYDSLGGIRVNIHNGGKPQTVKVRHNIIRDTFGTGGTSGYGIQLDDVIDVEVYNNTMAFLPGSSFWFDGTLQDVLIKNNLIVSCDRPHDNSHGFTGTTEFDYQGWFDAEALSADGANSISAPDASDVKFIDADGRDLGLAPDSPAKEAGVDVGLPYSGSAPDLGAYDFDSTVDWPSGGGESGGDESGSGPFGCGGSPWGGCCALPALVLAILGRRRR